MLLPVPDSPTTSTFSPGAISISASFTTALPSSKVTERSRNRSAPSSAGLRTIRPVVSSRSARSKRSSDTSKRGESARRRGPIGQARIVFDQPIERDLHDDERRGGLHHFAQGHGSGDVLGGAQEDRNDRREAVTGLRHNRGADVLHHQLAPALADRRECRVEAGALFGLAAEHRDAFAIFAQTCERVAVIGLRLVFVLRDDDEAAGDDDHRSAGQHRVDESGDHQKPRDAEHRASDRDRELAADEPEHADEGDRRDDGREDADGKFDRGLDTQTQILGHAIFRVAVIARNQVELIVTAAGEPLIEHVRVEPVAPLALQGQFSNRWPLPPR